MAQILVSGLVNVETTVRIENFPLPYYPVTYPFNGVQTRVSGVGLNISKALNGLGHQTSLLTQLGNDSLAQLVEAELRLAGINTSGVLPLLEETPQSVILFTPDGRRQIHVDLKTIQDSPYPEGQFEQALRNCDLAILCNINFSRPWLREARKLGKTVICDVHVLGDVHDPYNLDFIQNADVLFLSDEAIRGRELDFIQALAAISPAQVIIVGMGSRGAMLWDRTKDETIQLVAVETRPIVNTLGAGDALLSAFVHGLTQKKSCKESLARAIVFASWKIGLASAAEGFPDQKLWDKLWQENKTKYL